jgi:predicted O-methyltransferase YrrM
MSLLSNLRVRSRLLRVALTKRYVYRDILEIASAHASLPITDVGGNIDPFALMARLARPGGDFLPSFPPIMPSMLAGAPSGDPEWSTERSAAEFMARLTAIMRAQTVFEVGCFIGYTSVHIASVLGKTHGGSLHVVDIDAGCLAATVSNVDRFAPTKCVTPYHGASCDPGILAALPAAADIIFIDTSHDYEDTRAEIAAYSTRLNQGGCLVLHDSVRFPGVRKAIGEVRGSFDVCTFATELSNGMSVLIPVSRS